MSLVYIPLSDSGQQISIDSLSDSVCICTCVRTLMCTVCVHLGMCIHMLFKHLCVCSMSILVWVCVVIAVTDFCIRKLVKMSQRRKQLNSISAAAFKTTREPANGVRNLKSWKNKLEEVLTTWERSLFLEAFLYCMIVKAPLFWALLLLCELKCWILVVLLP